MDVDFEFYNNNLDFSRLSKLKIREGTDWNYSYYPILFKDESSLLTAQKKLRETNINPRRYFRPSLNKLPYINYIKMEIAEDVSTRVLCCPLFNGISNESLKKITDIINAD